MTVIASGREETTAYRVLMLRKGLEFEIKCPGMKLTAKAPSCYSIVKREFGFKGNKQKVLDQLVAHIEAAQKKAQADAEAKIEAEQS